MALRHTSLKVSESTKGRRETREAAQVNVWRTPALPDSLQPAGTAPGLALHPPSVQPAHCHSVSRCCWNATPAPAAASAQQQESCCPPEPLVFAI